MPLSTHLTPSVYMLDYFRTLIITYMNLGVQEGLTAHGLCTIFCPNNFVKRSNHYEITHG